MTANKIIVQLSLISIGLFLILATYFFYPKIIKNKFLEEETVEDVVTKTDMTDSKSVTHLKTSNIMAYMILTNHLKSNRKKHTF